MGGGFSSVTKTWQQVLRGVHCWWWWWLLLFILYTSRRNFRNVIIVGKKIQWHQQQEKKVTPCPALCRHCACGGFFFCTCGDLAEVGFGHLALGVIPGPVEKPSAIHGHTALIGGVAGLPGPPVSKEDWPAIRPTVGGVLCSEKMILFRIFFIWRKNFSAHFVIIWHSCSFQRTFCDVMTFSFNQCVDT